VINAPAGDTGLTTHDILWGDASRGTLPAGVPASALDFRFPDAVSIDRFRLRELVSAGKALDDQAAAMGAFLEPARQPWRGVGNLNITRFDRTSAIEAVQEWSSALADLLQAVRAIRAATQWEGIDTTEAARQVVQLIRALPPPEPEIACGLLPRMPDPSSAAALSKWADLVMSARQFEASADAICEREKMQSSLGSVRTLLEAAETLEVVGATLDELVARFIQIAG
jgi:hypothetical protein